MLVVEKTIMEETWHELKLYICKLSLRRIGLFILQSQLFHYFDLCPVLHVTLHVHVVSPPFYHRRSQLRLWLLKVLCSVRLWGHPELRPHTHSSGAPRPCQVPSAGLYGS